MNVWHWWKCRRKNNTFNKEQLTIALRKVCFEEKFKNRSTNGRRTLHLYAWYHSALVSGSVPVICLPSGSFLAFPLLCIMGLVANSISEPPLQWAWGRLNQWEIEGQEQGRSQGISPFCFKGLQWLRNPVVALGSVSFSLSSVSFALFPSLMLRLPPATVFQLLPPSL